MTKLVCVTNGAMPRVIIGCFVIEICRTIEWNARNSGRNLYRSFSTASVSISLDKKKLTTKTQGTSPKAIWSRFITIVYGDNQ